MQLTDKFYDILKWIVIICIPAIATAYVGFAAIWGWPFAEEISQTANILCVLLGAMLGISTAEYNKANK